MATLLIANGIIVTASGSDRADILVEDGRIAAVGSGLTSHADREIDATDRLVLPGGVDAHTHLDLPAGDFHTSDDFQTGTIAAAFGGTTTVIDYATQDRGGRLHDALDTWKRMAEGKAVIDYGFHMIVADLNDGVEREMDELVAEGVPSFKVFMAYPGRLQIDDEAIFRVLRRTARNGGITCLHAEDGEVIARLVRDALAAGHTGPAYHALTRPASAEVDAATRGIALAERAGAPLYVVHVSAAGTAAAIGAARARGLQIAGETCPQYLLLTDAAYNAPGFGGAKYVMSPPLRTAADQDALWSALEHGVLQTVATDHCPFNLVGQKDRGRDDFTQIPNGAPGIESRMSLLFDAGVRTGRLSLTQFVDVTSTAPARLFGLFPRKGTLDAGADADIVVWDPAREVTLSAARQHMRCDYSLFEGRVVRGAAETVIAGGRVIVEGGRFVGRPGGGRFLAREPRG